ncbi:MAG: hypothetical protein SH850_19845 [Planctomycetaceae bacterium]|nr:hypothetical protein [Planctomycetaceae bacterium]
MPRDFMRPEIGSFPDDEIVAEIRAIRHQLAAAVDFDLDRIFDQVKTVEADERARGRVIIPPPVGNSGAAA